MMLIQCLNETILREPEKGIYYLENGKYKFETYEHLRTNALNYLGALQELGIEEGQEVVFQTTHNNKFLYLLWACFLGGYIAIPTGFDSIEYIQGTNKVISKLKKPVLITELEKQCENIVLKDKFSLSSLDTKKITGRVTQNNSKDRIVMVQFSSGSTGEPKGVIYTDNTLSTNMFSILKSTEWKTEERILTWLTLTHNMGLASGHLAPLIKGMDQYLMPTREFIVHPINWLYQIDKYKINIVSCPNFASKLLIKTLNTTKINDVDLSSINMIINGSEPIDYGLCEELTKHLSKYKLRENCIYPVYGLAENTVAACLPKAQSPLKTITIGHEGVTVGEPAIIRKESEGYRVVSVGKAISETDIRIVDNDNKILPEGYYGNIELNGLSVTPGYYNNEKESEKIFSDDGWLKTGDQGLIFDNELYIFGREKEIIIIYGHNYYPNDIEQTIVQKIPELSGRVVIIGVNNSNSNEEVFCFIEKRQSENIFDLYKYGKKIKKIVNKFKKLQINEVYPISVIPKTRSQKLKRVELRQRIQGGEFLEYNELFELLNLFEEQTIENTIENFIILFTEYQLGLKNIELNTNFFELGFSSITIMKFVEMINLAFDTEISETDIFFYETPKLLAEYIEEQIRLLS
ncbi:mutanobactin A non-ribosomal peptide synthetase MubE [Streptococcus mutans]|uniref:mutanobactin A non-ribosomal peptide synthetase MubE n=1 Tax=Streptococcus mutans TaxID=1309 RepID=UPI00124AE3C8|nr:mutanobactin A non-ribosomal peptide synthetase MubE [Streptococcus mutans]